MKSVRLIIPCLSFLIATNAIAQPPSKLTSLIQNHCIQCHDADTETRLNLEDPLFVLTDTSSFRTWENVYDRIRKGEMPPATEPPLDPKTLNEITAFLKRKLQSANITTQKKRGRVPARRLTRTEYEHTLRDLFSIDGRYAELLPEESREGSFDTVATAQHISALHLESYLAATDRALNTTIRLHKTPYRTHSFDLLNNEHLNSFHERDLQIGGNISRKLDDGVVVFRDVDYLLRSDLHGFRVRSTGSGNYQIKITAEAFQSEQPVLMKVVVKDVSGDTELIGAFDLIPGETHSFELNAWLTKTKVFYVALLEDRPPAQILADIYDAGGAQKYDGPGITVKSIQVAGPHTGGWPPASTRRVLTDVELVADSEGRYATQLSNSPLEHVRQIVADIAPTAIRRPLAAGELEAFVNLAKPAIKDELPFVDVVRIPLRAVLTSPQFLMLAGPAGRLDNYSLASRLSFFLWKSLPDDELVQLAEQGLLSDHDVLKTQVDRMLNDKKAKRFVHDFLGQWWRLHEINSTTPDEKLYPEYDETLHWSIPQESELFFAELIRNDLSINHLIDSDFTFLNRRLATHYGLDEIVGQQFRKVILPPNSLRGGILTQASVLKVTANGLVTSPVKRGDFVLSDLLGTPPPPPPSNVGSIEPNVSTATTIREMLAKHRDVESCAQCHQKIDPPGFALESFDPIGGFRTHYRRSCDDFLTFVAWMDGAEVDASGTTADGKTFAGIDEFKFHLMAQNEQLARHFISQLVAYSTGGEIEFADRDEISAILDRTRTSGFPIRTILHEVIQSRLFRNR